MLDINKWEESNKFDIIISKETFEHVIDLEVVLESMYNLLKKMDEYILDLDRYIISLTGIMEERIQCFHGFI